MLPIKNYLKGGDAPSPLCFDFALVFVIRRVRVKQDGLKLNGTHQLLVYADDENIWGGSVPTVKENTESLAVTSKEAGLKVNADRTNYMVKYLVTRMQQQNHNIKIGNKSNERVEHLKYLRTILTVQNFIHIKCKSTLKSGDACYHTGQNIASYSLLSTSKVHPTTGH